MRPKNPVGEPFIELSEVDSTNNYAMRQVQAQMAVHGAVWFADYQNAGKGQRGKVWEAGRRQNIMMSAVLEPGFLPVDNQFLLSVCVSLACFDLFNKYSGRGTSIKWPNDIYWNDRKAGGILIENILQGKDWKFAIAGTGININQTLFAGNLRKAVSLQQITGKTYDVIELAKELCGHLESRWNQLCKKKYDTMLDEYCLNLYKTGETVRFENENQVFEAKVLGVNKQGDLLVNAQEFSVLPYGSVKWLLPV